MTVDQKIATLGNDGIYRAADFSPCRTWRYTLRRTWAPLKPRLLMTLLNPSKADETRDDRATERHLDKVDPKGELRARWRAIHDELERRESMDTLDRDGPALEAERDKIFEVLFP